MVFTPFHDIPRKSFLLHMLAPSIGVFVFCFFVVGVIANSAGFHKPEGPVRVIPFWQMAFHHYGTVISEVFHIPQVCLLGTEVNEFQAHQCDEFWNELFKSGGLASVPLLCVGFFLFLGIDDLSATYKRAQKKIEKGAFIQKGTVTDPPEAPTDFYSWFYCFRPIMVELKSKEQVKIYIPEESQTPKPGTQLLIYEIGKSLGEKRCVGIVYAPHIAVVRGE